MTRKNARHETQDFAQNRDTKEPMHPYGTSAGEPAELGSESLDAVHQREVEARGSAREQSVEARGSAREQSVEARGSAREQTQEPSARDARWLIEAIRELALAKNGAAIARVVRAAAARLVATDSTTLVLSDGDALVVADDDPLVPGWKSMRFPMSDLLSRLVIERREQIAIADVGSDSRVRHEYLHTSTVRSMVLTPVRGGNASAAMVAAFWTRHYEPTARELFLLQDLADLTAVATENTELCAKLERRVELRTSELREANRDLEAFSYSVAHDLRAPLSALLVTRSILERCYGSNLDTQGIKLLQDIERSGKRMGELIGGLLQFARCARVELSKQEVDLSTLARGIVVTLRQHYLSRNIRVSVEPHLLVHADRTLMEVVLNNLLNNAFKYTRETARAEVHVGGVRDGAKRIVFVSDNGVGFDASRAAELFTPFKRLHSAQTFEGHGVGLATVARIVNKHGGAVWAESKGQGATFFFSLPEHDEVGVLTEA
jgi:signal transduction histidine kinase